MDELELETRMTDTEADMANLDDIRQNLGKFAKFIDMITEEEL